MLADEVHGYAQCIAYSVHEAAAATCVSPATIRRAIQAGKLEARRVGSRILIEPDALRQWVHGSPIAGRG